MPDKELQGFNINFHTNAAQAAEDVDKLNEAQQRLSKDTEKSDNKSSKRRTRSNKDLRQAVKELKELNKTLKQQREETLEIGKIEEANAKQRKASIAAAGRAVKILAVAKAAVSMVQVATNKVAENAEWANLSGALNSPGVRAFDIAQLALASRTYGGTKESAVQDFTAINSVIAQLKQGENPFGDLAGKFPGLTGAFIKKEGGFYGETEVLTNLNRLLLGTKDPYLQRSLIKQLGLSDSTFQLLLQQHYSRLLEKQSEEAAKTVRNSKTDRDTTDTMARYRKMINNFFKNQYSEILKVDGVPETIGTVQGLWDNFGGVISTFGQAWIVSRLARMMGGAGRGVGAGAGAGSSFWKMSGGWGRVGKMAKISPFLFLGADALNAYLEVSAMNSDTARQKTEIESLFNSPKRAREKDWLITNGYMDANGKLTTGGYAFFRKNGFDPDTERKQRALKMLPFGSHEPEIPQAKLPKITDLPPSFLTREPSLEDLQKINMRMLNTGAFLPPMPQPYFPASGGTSNINIDMGGLTINAPGGDPEQIAAAGTQLVEQVRDVIAAEFRMNDYATATTYNA